MSRVREAMRRASEHNLLELQTADPRLARQAAAVLRDRSDKLSHFEFRVNYKTTYVEEPFALVQVLSPRPGDGSPEERIVRGYDTAEAMYEDVISNYSSPTPAPKAERPSLKGRLLAAFHSVFR